MARREVIELEGFAHGNPIPVAVKIGNMVYTGGVAGTNEAGTTPADSVPQECIRCERKFLAPELLNFCEFGRF